MLKLGLIVISETEGVFTCSILASIVTILGKYCANNFEYLAGEYTRFPYTVLETKISYKKLKYLFNFCMAF